MLKKSILVFLVLLLSSLAIAQNATNSTSPQSNANVIDKAYQCLKNQIEKESTIVSLQEAIFGTLALGSNSKLNAVMDGKIKNENHWEESVNQIKDTSQALLAYNRINKNTEKIETWLLSNKRTATDLTWYLEIDIDNHESSSCKITYNNEPKTVNIREDMTLSGNAGSCLTPSAGGFWLRISNTCIDNNFTVSCDKDFTTSTLYQRTGSSTVFVSPVAHSTSALGTTTESVNSKCFSTTTTGCDYEGTLWATIALDKSGKDISDYLPYLLALSESNQRFLPSSFLFILTDGQDQYSQLVQSQKENKYWQAPNTLYSRYYDSALALLALQGSSSAEETSSKTYFESITTAEGCWNNNNIRDTAFLLYAGWPRLISTGGGGPSPSQSCASAGYSCISLTVCNGLGGNKISDYVCPNTGICCSKSPIEQSCAEQSGNVCSSVESCSGSSVSSSDGSCCLGTCDPIPQADQCTQAGGKCYSTCDSSEIQTTDTCSGDDVGKVCCKSTGSEPESDTNWGLWITLLIILIALVVVGIIFKDKLKMMLFKLRNKPSTKGPGQSTSPPPGPGRPPFPPFRGPVPYPRAQPRIINPSNQPVRRPMPTPSKDNEMEETMRKLREMGK